MRRRLVLVALAITSAVVIAFLVPLALLVQQQAHDRAMSNTERNAESLARTLVVFQPEPGETLERFVAAAPSVDGETLAVITPTGEVFGHAEIDEDLVEQTRNARSTILQPVDDGEAIAVPVVDADGQTTVVYGFASDDLLRRNVVLAWSLLGALGIFSVLLSVALADRLGRSMVTPVEALSEAASQLGDGDLDTRVSPAGPREIERTGHAFNQLAARIGELISTEREAIADTSHRLRTPLTALALDVGAIENEELRLRIQDDVAEMERTVDHVISQARRPVREGVGVSSDLAEVVRSRTSFWAPLAEEQNRGWSVHVPDQPVVVSGHPDDVAAAIDALLTNVFSHTADGAQCEVTLTQDGELSVIDAGEGFALDMAERGKSGAGSTGLGLDIARQAVEAHGGSMDLQSDSSGTSVILRFAHRA